MKRGDKSAQSARNKHTLSYQLREVIESRGLSAYAAGKLAGVDPGVVQRFLTGERDIRMGTADRLGLALGVRLVEVARKGGAPAPRPAPSRPAPARVEDAPEGDVG